MEGSPSACSPPSAAGKCVNRQAHHPEPAVASCLRASRGGLQEWTLGRTCCLLAPLPSLVPPTLPPTYSGPLASHPLSHPQSSNPTAVPSWLVGHEGAPQPRPGAALAGVWSNPRILTAPLHPYDTWQITDSSSRMDGETCRPGDRASICWGLGWVFFFHTK